ncbi:MULTISPECIES: hypothetical protein [unclassified Streptomyces]|uniref:hypothetical protein n=1 Tax=unclassified Streptomyces TaxID=2593676 RepID=UPI002252C5DB|nr:MULTISPECIES: hypothetical protein [unclassified Streptomyces]MCX5334285.1 hypothetical protein [Streptomyces sp. NBC_00140]MCX5363792.1 hypothetical protein [Streptomyces sp. NBC_00124]
MGNRRAEEQRAPKRKVLDLTLVQVVASALATVVGAVLASLLGVTGTIIGAAVISTSATTGAAVFSHAFRRTGEGIRSRVPPVGVPRTPGEERAEHRADARAAFGSPADATAVAARPQPFGPGGPASSTSSGGESVTTYRGGSLWRSIGWKRYALATGLVFALAMVTVTAVELIAGKPVAAVVKNQPGRGTSVGGGTAGTPAPADSRTPTPGASSGTAPQTDSSAAPDASSAPDTSSGPGFSSGPSASLSAGPSDPAPSASSAPSSDGAVNSSDAIPH